MSSPPGWQTRSTRAVQATTPPTRLRNRTTTAATTAHQNDDGGGDDSNSDRDYDPVNLEAAVRELNTCVAQSTNRLRRA